ncbi:MAG: hypothetical protein FJX76_13345 [Armatimonadetes bacterium]|nr:hypothetical protein [Armatimonadota bacterium]
MQIAPTPGPQDVHAWAKRIRPERSGDRFVSSSQDVDPPPSASSLRALCASASFTSLPLPHDLRGSTVYNRINLPWLNFGVDFGVTAWGDLGIRNNPQAAPTLDRMRALGVEDVITWTVPDGRTIRFAADGTPSGLAPGFREDLTAWLDLLSARGMSAELVLIDGNTWFLPGAVSDGVAMRGHGDVITDRSGRKQAAFDRHVLGPMLDTIRAWHDAHPGAPSPISGINLGNELEYGVNRDPKHPSKNVTSMDQMSRFARGRADFIRQRLPGVPLTVGSASPDALFQNWAVPWLDYYTFHHYGTESLASLADRLPWPGLGGRVHLGEYPGRRPNGAPVDARDYLAALGGRRGDSQRAENADRFLRGAAVWASRTTDPACPADPAAHMAATREWFDGAFTR